MLAGRIVCFGKKLQIKVKQVTISQIAKEAGYGQSTAGHVLNGRAAELRISQKACERIQEVARKYNYVANPLASGLRGGRTRAVGILWSLGGPHANESVIRPLTFAISKREYVAYVSDCAATPLGPVAMLKSLKMRGADGIVMQVSDVDLLNHPQVAGLIRSFPMRVLVVPEPVSFDADLVIHDRLAAIRHAATYLLKSGRRRLVYVAKNLETINQSKGNAVLEAVAAFGGGATAQLVDVGQATSPSQCFSVFDDSPAISQADALLFSNDGFAAAGLRWLEQAGRRCPDDVAVVGFNNSELSELFSPALATVDRANLLLAEQIGQLIEHRLDHPDADYQTRDVPMEFICRASAGSAKGVPSSD